jgi:hypothetical protein
MFSVAYEPTRAMGLLMVTACLPVSELRSSVPRGEGIKLYGFLTLASDRGECQFHTPTTLYIQGNGAWYLIG